MDTIRFGHFVLQQQASYGRRPTTLLASPAAALSPQVLFGAPRGEYSKKHHSGDSYHRRSGHKNHQQPDPTSYTYETTTQYQATTNAGGYPPQQGYGHQRAEKSHEHLDQPTKQRLKETSETPVKKVRIEPDVPLSLPFFRSESGNLKMYDENNKPRHVYYNAAKTVMIALIEDAHRDVTDLYNDKHPKPAKSHKRTNSSSRPAAATEPGRARGKSVERPPGKGYEKIFGLDHTTLKHPFYGSKAEGHLIIEDKKGNIRTVWMDTKSDDMLARHPVTGEYVSVKAVFDRVHNDSREMAGSAKSKNTGGVAVAARPQERYEKMTGFEDARLEYPFSASREGHLRVENNVGMLHQVWHDKKNKDMVIQNPETGEYLSVRDLFQKVHEDSGKGSESKERRGVSRSRSKVARGRADSEDKGRRDVRSKSMPARGRDKSTGRKGRETEDVKLKDITKVDVDELNTEQLETVEKKQEVAKIKKDELPWWHPEKHGDALLAGMAGIVGGAGAKVAQEEVVGAKHKLIPKSRHIKKIAVNYEPKTRGGNRRDLTHTYHVNFSDDEGAGIEKTIRLPHTIGNSNAFQIAGYTATSLSSNDVGHKRESKVYYNGQNEVMLEPPGGTEMYKREEKTQKTKSNIVDKTKGTVQKVMGVVDEMFGRGNEAEVEASGAGHNTDQGSDHNRSRQRDHRSRSRRGQVGSPPREV